MKNNFLFVAIVAAMIACLPGCKSSIPEVDVFDLSNGMVNGAFENVETRSKTAFDDMCLNVTEWTLDTAKQQIACKVYRYGNGVNETIDPVNYYYAKGAVNADGLGVHYTFTPVAGGEAIDVLYWGNALIIDKDTIADAKAPSINMNKIAENFPNHAWKYEQTDYHILYDTIQTIDTIITTVRRPDPVTGKPVTVKDTTYKEVTIINEDTIGVLYHEIQTYNFARNATTLANDCHYTQLVEKFKANEDNTAMIPDGDPVNVETNYAWALSSITSASRFVITLKDGEEFKALNLSGFDLTKGTLVVGGTLNFVLDDKD